MKRVMCFCSAVLPLMLTGCGSGEGGGASASSIYGAAAVLSLLLLIGYCVIDRKRDKWFLLLFSSVLMVNIGYFALSVSKNLESALMANRIAYLGSVFLPLSMLMIILDVTKFRVPKWLPALLLVLAGAVFLIAASPGILDIYYKEVTFVTKCGASALKKVYGPLHFVYGVYLFCYFSAMVAVVLRAYIAQKLESTGHAVILAIAVMANMGVWLVEQLADFNFEFLSISYIISELFLLGLHLRAAEHQRLKHLVTEREQALNAAVAEMSSLTAAAKDETAGAEPAAMDRCKVKQFTDGILDLTETEKAIFDAYTARMSTKEVMAALHIKENTLKFHNKNLYHKLGVSSRKELLEIHKRIREEAAQRE